MARFFRLAPWPGDFTRLDAAFRPSRADGVCALDDDATPPAGAVEIDASEYEITKAAILDEIGRASEPPDTELAQLRQLAAKGGALTAGEVRDLIVQLAARLDQRGLLG